MLIANVAEHSNMICSVIACKTTRMAEDFDLDSESGRLRWARIRAGYDSATEFARAASVNPTSYRAYENGQNKFSKLAASFGRLLGVSAEWLIEGGPSPIGAIPEKPETIDRTPDMPRIRISDSDEATLEVRQVDLGYAMGPGTHIDDYPDETPIRFDSAFLRSISRANAEQLFVARGDGDSMFPTLINDDQVMIDTTQRTLNMQDRIWAVSVYGAGMIKRLRAAGGGKVLVMSDNPAVSDQEVDAADLHIVGRVIWVGRRI